MIKKVLLGLMVLALSSLSLLSVSAQDTLTAEEPITSELTSDDYALFYSYEGKKDDVVVITMTPSDVMGDLESPSIILRDPKGRDLVRTDSYFGAVELITLLPSDGEYTVIATRVDDAAGESVGEFTLSVMSLSELKVGDVIEDTTDSESKEYYLYRQSDDFVLRFTHEGDYSPAISINKLDEEYSPGTLQTLFTAGGSLNIPVVMGPIPGDELYVIQIAEGTFDFNFDTVEASYTIEVNEVEAR